MTKIKSTFTGAIELKSGIKILITPPNKNLDCKLRKKINALLENRLSSIFIKTQCLAPEESNKYSLPPGFKNCLTCYDIDELSSFASRGKGRHKSLCKDCDNKVRRQKYKRSTDKPADRDILIGLNFSGEQGDPGEMTDSIYSILKTQSLLTFQVEVDINVDALIRPKNKLLM